MALYRCDWEWYDSTKARPTQERDQAFTRVFAAAEGANPGVGQHVKGWYTYPGRAAGFLLVEANTAEELAAILRPYVELMEFEVQPVVAIDYEQARRRIMGQP